MKNDMKQLIAKIALFYALIQFILADISLLHTSIYSTANQIRIFDFEYRVLSTFIISAFLLALTSIIAAIYSYVRLLLNFIFPLEDTNEENDIKSENKKFVRNTKIILLYIIIGYIFSILISISIPFLTSFRY